MGLQVRESSAEGGSPRWWPELGWPDWICYGSLSALLVALCIARSRSRLLWADELLGFALLRNPVLTHILHGWWEGADGGGLLYYVIGYVWFRLFGSTPLVLRLLSTSGFIVGIGIIWVMARRFYTTAVVAPVTILVFLLPPFLVWQACNGRFYGIFLAAAAFTAACTMAAVERKETSSRLLVLTCCAHSALIGSHVLGVVYSVGLLVAMVISDLLERRKRPLLYGSVLLAWLLLLPLSFHAIQATTAVAHGVFWPALPHMRDLVLGFFAYSHKLLALAELLELAIIARYLSGASGAETMRKQFRAHRSGAVVIGGLLLAQIAIFLKSHIGLSVYSDRYLVPLTIGLVLLLAEGLTQALGPVAGLRLSAPLPTLALAIVASVLAFAIAKRSDPYGVLYPSLDYPAKLERLLPPEHDVVATYTPIFLLMSNLDPSHHYIFMTDWRYDDRVTGADLSGQRMMQNLERGGIAHHQVLDINQIVQETPDFTLIAEPDRLPWLKDRFESSGEFSVEAVGSLPDWYPMTIWRVRCLHPLAGCRVGTAGPK